MPSAWGLRCNPSYKRCKKIMDEFWSNSAKRNFVDLFGVAQIRLRRRRQVDRRAKRGAFAKRKSQESERVSVVSVVKKELLIGDLFVG